MQSSFCILSRHLTLISTKATGGLNYYLQPFLATSFLGVLSTATPTPNPFGHCDRCNMLYNVAIVVHISSQLHFISVDSYRTFVREGPHLRNMRKYWKKFKKWLKYRPNKSYMRGNGISSSKLTPTKSTN